MKRNIMAILVALLLVLALFLVGTGFLRRSDVVLVGHTLSPDGTHITLHTTVAGSMGYTRGFRNRGGGVKPHYLNFFSTFGGLNSRLGAKNVFVLPVGEDCNEIYFNRPDGGYELVLYRDEATGEWMKP